MAKAADIFISYRRDVAEPSGPMVELLLRDLKDPSSNVPLSGFLDHRTIPPGGDWRESIKFHASECKVLVVLIGPDWLDRFSERGFLHLDHLNPDDDEIDWVAAELQYALDRETPAELILVKANGGIQLDDAAEVFDSNIKVSVAFTKGKLQEAYLRSGSNEDEENLKSAVVRAYTEYDASTVTVVEDRTPERKHWLKFMGRATQWQQVGDQLQVSLPGEMSKPKHTPGTFALCWPVNTRKDYPENLADALNHHLAADGDRLWHAEDHSDAPSFYFQNPLNPAQQFEQIADVLGFGSSFRLPINCGDAEAVQRIQEDFVRLLTEMQSTNDRVGCCYCLFDTSQGEHSKLASSICSLWNRLSWPAMKFKFLLVFLELGGKPETSLNQPVIGKFSQNCYNQWINGFLSPTNRFNVRQRDPDWHQFLRSYEWQDEQHYSDIEMALTKIR